MSYDIRLKDRVTDETIELPVKHLMTGGTYHAEYDEKSGEFYPTPIQEAWLNITYNYAHYYYEAAEGDDRFITVKDHGDDIGEIINAGIRGIYGKTGAQSIPMLQDMIARIIDKYKVDGDWLVTSRTKYRYYDKKTGEEINNPVDALFNNREYVTEEYVAEVSEGPDPDYWEPTAGNAIKPLYQLIAMAQLRPDGVWDGD